MFRSLHMKLVLIMILLVTALMTVVGVFLVNAVSRFYLDDFYSQMVETFSQESFVRDLTVQTAEESDAVEALTEVLAAYVGVLGVDGRNRNYYILDAEGGVLASSNDVREVEPTVNLMTALVEGVPGTDSSLVAQEMDVAIPITRDGVPYIIYIKDSGATAQALSNDIFILIIQSLGFGLLISLLLSVLLSKTLVIPIQRLTEGAERMATGDFENLVAVESGDEIGILTHTFHDMAQQLQRTLGTVKQEQMKLHTLFLNMTDGVVAVSPHGGVIHANPSAERLLLRELPIGDYLGTDALGLPPWSDLFYRAEEGVEQREVVLGSQHLQLTFAPFSTEPEEGLLVVIHDVTEQMKTEQIRREFVANVSHELRTPLTNIRSYAETLADGRALPEALQQEFLQVILSESDRMIHIVKDLLTLSRFDSSHESFDFDYFSLKEALEDLYNAVKLEMRRREHVLRLHIAESLPEIWGDRSRIVQVLMNILSNAMKYTPDGGEIVLSAGREETFVWVEVRDNGIGIPGEDRERIFERFYRVDKARSRESGGTGLGLSIAKEIVKRHGGDLYLLPTDGRGTTLRLVLPLEGAKDEG